MNPNNIPLNRPATLDEMERAHHALMTFSGISGSCKKMMLKAEIACSKMGTADQNSASRPLVIHDFFSVIDSPAEFLLVPAGTYDIPAEFFQRNQDRCIIGLPWKKADFPTLRLEGLPWQKSLSIYANSRGAETVPYVIDASSLRFANVRLDSVVPTVLEIQNMEVTGGFLTSLHQHVEYSKRIEVLDSIGDTLCLGREWAHAAYGPECGARHAGIKMLEGAYMGLLSGVDGIFKPLVAMGERIDRALGWK